ncbi:endonuclease [Rhizobium sp. NBRC 114257]|uniref:Endonuclease n=1 Tax=Rhizobium dioscoreae TaxID=2653122 RepID=A0ABQ0Z5E4_9HYPH|nr:MULTISPECIES: endonuclease/exonuclease/phosphatase family protein [Rhizobium]GES50763.1 endonuclease [Rhizobium dioscoreae]GLU81475.1 endonuclease [Rhizobium sp. NBRC 114257]
MIRNTVSAFTVPSQEERKSFISLEKAAVVHAEKLASLACLNTVRIGGADAKIEVLSFPFTVAAWNLERCLFPEESAAKLRETSAPLVLLSEMDYGMARTEQRDPTVIIAGELGMNYAYGVEFLELSLGSEIERSYCKDDFNEKGFHGNALMASIALKDAFMIRLPGEAVWFNDSNEQPRIGDRCAVGAIVETEAGPMIAVSVHLESVATAAYRERQLAALIDEVEAFAPGLPILIGGDLNTGNHTGGDFSTDTLFTMSEGRGFECHGGPLDQTSTRPSLITRFPDRAMKLDWFITRGLKVRESHLVSSLNGEGKPLSDHDMVVCTIEGFST